MGHTTQQTGQPAIDDAAALRAKPRAFDVEGARDKPATWAEWFCANPVPETTTPGAGSALCSRA